MNKIRMLIRKYYDVLAYLFFGVLTTVVNYIVYLPCYNLLHISAAASNVIAWAAAVIFAYLTNKPFVFKSHDWSRKTVAPELTKFVGIGDGYHFPNGRCAALEWQCHEAAYQRSRGNS